MSTSSLTPTDLRVRDAVLRQLEWDSQLDASAVGVTARDGVVTMTGFIDSYAGKLAAERAAKRVAGVRGVANDIQVRLRLERTDPEIASDAVRALDVRAGMSESVQAVVHNGHVTLTGTVPTLFQRAVAEKALRYIKGLKGVINRIHVVSPGGPDTRSGIIRALRGNAEINARGIEVTVSGNTVTLTGAVKSWHERESAERAAMHAPGITHVDNQLAVEWLEHEPEDEIC